MTFLDPTLNLWQSFSASSTVKRWLVQLTRPDVDYLQYAVNANVCSLFNSWNSQFYPFSQILILNNIITNTHISIYGLSSKPTKSLVGDADAAGREIVVHCFILFQKIVFIKRHRGSKQPAWIRAKGERCNLHFWLFFDKHFERVHWAQPDLHVL